ncbi:MAG: hypothetical protein NVSMB6_05140 [Burkholderiaceae bacterium]
MSLLPSVGKPPPAEAHRDAVAALNRDCFCISLDREALSKALDSELGQPGLAALVRQRCAFMFAAEPVYLAQAPLRAMQQVVRAVEAVVTLPAYREAVLAASPRIAQLPTGGSRGAFFGYDFHLDHGRPRLIEINTNAGGAMLNAVLARAQRATCEATQSMAPTLASIKAFENAIVDMFRREWAMSGHGRPLTSIAIVDDQPEEQYLYPEFLLFQQLFERHGLRAVITDPGALERRDGKLWLDDLAVDLVYNRLTDFYLEQPTSAALRAGYVDHEVVVTPHPQSHALYADKRRLAMFSDAACLEALGVPEPIRQVLLEHVPSTEVVDAADAARLWNARRTLFFKPVSGFGSRGAYRGDKLTRRVWQDILAGDYVAQAIVAPGERMVGAQDATQPMKYDLRAYAYDGAVQWVAARMFQGQTTNFRTPGGGFAPVYTAADAPGQSLTCCDERVPPGQAAEKSHASYVFLLDTEGNIHPLPHTFYVALARGLTAAPTLADRTLRLVDWFVQLENGAPGRVINETYSRLYFDSTGKIDFSMHSAVDPSGVKDTAGDSAQNRPSAEEYAALRKLLFDGAGNGGSAPTAFPLLTVGVCR